MGAQKRLQLVDAQTVRDVVDDPQERLVGRREHVMQRGAQVGQLRQRVQGWEIVRHGGRRPVQVGQEVLHLPGEQAGQLVPRLLDHARSPDAVSVSRDPEDATGVGAPEPPAVLLCQERLPDPAHADQADRPSGPDGPGQDQLRIANEKAVKVNQLEEPAGERVRGDRRARPPASDHRGQLRPERSLRSSQLSPDPRDRLREQCVEYLRVTARGQDEPAKVDERHREVDQLGTVDRDQKDATLPFVLAGPRQGLAQLPLAGRPV